MPTMKTIESLRTGLLNAAPSVMALKNLGLSDNEVQSLRSSFTLVLRENKTAPIKIPLSHAGEFFSLYDPSCLEIGMINFLPQPEINGDGYCVGMVESDPLLINEETQEVFVDDLTSPGHTLWYCAKDFEHFLAALLPAAQYLAVTMIDELEERARHLLDKHLNDCVEAAGGIRYESFYRMLLGK